MQVFRKHPPFPYPMIPLIVPWRIITRQGTMDLVDDSGNTSNGPLSVARLVNIYNNNSKQNVFRRDIIFHMPFGMQPFVLVLVGMLPMPNDTMMQSWQDVFH